MKIDIAILKSLQHQIEQSNQKAFEGMYRLFFPRLYNFALLYVHKKEVAEELVNDIMVKVWEKRATLHTIENIETYLFTAVRNHSLNYLRKFSHYHIVLEEEQGLAEVISLNNPEKALEWKEINYKLNLAIEQLPTQCRTVFKLIKEDGLSYKQVAEILGLSPRTVETQLFRAIKKLSLSLDGFLEKRVSKKSTRNPLSTILLLIAIHG